MRIVHQDRIKTQDRLAPMDAMFVGTVLLQDLVSDSDAPSLRVASLTFVDHRWNTWHAHKTEQVLVVPHGAGVVDATSGARGMGIGDDVSSIQTRGIGMARKRVTT
jgi:hypothetical protein